MLRILDQTRYEIFREVLAGIAHLAAGREENRTQQVVDAAYQITQAAAEKLKSAGIAEARE